MSFLTPQPRSSTLLRPNLDLAPLQGLHAKYGQDNVNKTVMFFLTTVQQQLEKHRDQNDFFAWRGRTVMLFKHQSEKKNRRGTTHEPRLSSYTSAR